MRETLDPLMLANGDRVHFRPSSTGVTLVGLLPDRPQRGARLQRDLARIAEEFEALFATHCRDVPQGRVTGEKALQSFLIRNANGHRRRLACLNEASAATNAPVDLIFVTDEIPVPTAQGKIVCDLLAYRAEGERKIPVLLELKDARMLTRLVEQVDNYAALIDVHLDLYAELFSAVLGDAVSLTERCEKWIVWPSAGAHMDPREAGLLNRGIRLVGYQAAGDDFRFRIGQGNKSQEARSALLDT